MTCSQLIRVRRDWQSTFTHDLRQSSQLQSVYGWFWQSASIHELRLLQHFNSTRAGTGNPHPHTSCDRRVSPTSRRSWCAEIPVLRFFSEIGDVAIRRSGTETVSRIIRCPSPSNGKEFGSRDMPCPCIWLTIQVRSLRFLYVCLRFALRYAKAGKQRFVRTGQPFHFKVVQVLKTFIGLLAKLPVGMLQMFICIHNQKSGV